MMNNICTWIVNNRPKLKELLKRYQLNDVSESEKDTRARSRRERPPPEACWWLTAQVHQGVGLSAALVSAEFVSGSTSV